MFYKKDRQPGVQGHGHGGAALPAVCVLPLTEIRPPMALVFTAIVQEERRHCRMIRESATASASLPLDGDDLSPTAHLLDAGVRL